MHQILKELERDVQRNFFVLVDQIKEDLYDQDKCLNNPSCVTALPNMFKALHKLKAIINEYEKVIIEPTISKRKICCSYSSKNKREFLLEKQAKELAIKKQKLLKQATDFVLKKQKLTESSTYRNQDNNSKTEDREAKFAESRWNKLKQLNSIKKKQQQEECSRKQKYDSILFRYINNLSLSKEEKETLVNDCQYYMGCPFEELKHEQIDTIGEDSYYDDFDKSVLDPFLGKIEKIIKKDPKISLEELSKAILLDEYYLSKFLAEFGIYNTNGQWIIPSSENKD